jgi:hypothetical protein
MAASLEVLIPADFEALRTAIAGSPIVIRPVAPRTDWAQVRRTLHADAFVLTWIASHARTNRSRAH